GPLDVSPIELDLSDLTIQAADGFHPVLRLGSGTARPNAALFALYQGAVTFRNLNFRLKPSLSEKAKRAVVAITGAGKCTFERCATTLEESDNGQFALVVLATDADAPQAENGPRIRLKQCFVRGKGDVFAVRGSRSFDLQVEDTLAALDGSFIAVQAASRDVPTTPAA